MKKDLRFIAIIMSIWGVTIPSFVIARKIIKRIDLNDDLGFVVYCLLILFNLLFYLYAEPFKFGGKNR